MSTSVKIGRRNFSANLHDANRFAVALGMRRAEIAVDALLHVAALLRGDDEHFFAMEAGHAADDGGIIAEAAVAVNLAEIGEHALDVVERLRTLGMARQFSFLPGGVGSVDLSSQGFDAVLQFGDLATSCSSGSAASISATCRSISSSSCWAFSVDAIISATSTYDADTAAAAQLFDASDEVTVWKHIIAFRLHHHHEIALTFHIEQHSGFAFALDEKHVQIVNRVSPAEFRAGCGCG